MILHSVKNKHFALKIDGKEDDPVIRLPVGANGLFSGASC